MSPTLGLRRLRLCGTLGVVVVGGACGPRAKHTVPAETAAVAATGARPLPTNESKPVPKVFELVVEPRRVLLDGREMGALAPDAVRRIDGLYEELVRRVRGAPARRDYRVTVRDGVHGVQAISALQTAAFAGWRHANLQGTTKPVTIDVQIPLLPGASTDPGPKWPTEILVVIVRKKTLELWRVPTTATEPRGLATLAHENIPLGLPHLLELECKAQSPCNPMMFQVSADAEFAVVKEALSIAAASTAEPLSATLSMSAVPPGGKPPSVRLGATRVSGRLPPAVIQKIIRGHYDTLRKCYEQGLVRDPHLQGRVTVKFVIERDGRVTQSHAAEGASMPDGEVVECVVNAFRSLVFPKPEGGIVTVIYPVTFSPG